MSGSKKSYDLQGLNVLIVDDNKHIQLLMKEILRAFGIRSFQTAEDGAGALEILKTFVADLVICDWNMSPVDGLEFVDLLRKSTDSSNPFVPVIMLTGYTEYHRVTEARDHGVTEFLAKPVSPKALYDRVVRIIENPRIFVRSKNYVGPDRRRNTSRKYDGPERREIDGDDSGGDPGQPQDEALAKE